MRLCRGRIDRVVHLSLGSRKAGHATRVATRPIDLPIVVTKQGQTDFRYQHAMESDLWGYATELEPSPVRGITIANRPKPDSQ